MQIPRRWSPCCSLTHSATPKSSCDHTLEDNPLITKFNIPDMQLTDLQRDFLLEAFWRNIQPLGKVGKAEGKIADFHPGIFSQLHPTVLHAHLPF
ncbi:MAG: hypothetical protein HC925_03285 [Coleofasciculaceae cyanobacterium SM2_3_26]|nr:hypothetical protein [Coleofasciculaceae cyanobacterium SM2_3_26]